MFGGFMFKLSCMFKLSAARAFAALTCSTQLQHHASSRHPIAYYTLCNRDVVCLCPMLEAVWLTPCGVYCCCPTCRGIDVVRNKIKMFAQKKVTLPPGRHKVVILDEADRCAGVGVWGFACKSPWLHAVFDVPCHIPCYHVHMGPYHAFMYLCGFHTKHVCMHEQGGLCIMSKAWAPWVL